MRPFGPMMKLLLLCSLLSTGISCAKPVPKAAFDDASVDCDQAKRKDCWSVTPAYIKEHAVLYDKLIRTTSALKQCQEKH